MLNKADKSVRVKTSRIAECSPELARRITLRVAITCRTLLATSAGLLSALTFAQSARADNCASQAQDCSGVEQALTAYARNASAGAEGGTAVMHDASEFAGIQPVDGQQQIVAFATTAPAVTDYIAVSDNVVQGTRTSASGALNAMAIGPTAEATGINALAVGGGAAAGSDASTAIGSGAGALSVNATVIGAGSTVGALSDNSVAIGYNARSSAINSTSIGTLASATSTGAVAIGYNVFVAQAATNSVALGPNSSVSARNSVALGGDSIADRVNVVAVGNATQERQIVYVADGTQATDAANIGQLSRVANALGGGAQINADGSFTAPAYHVQGGTQGTVGEALGSLDNGLSTLQQNMAVGGIGVVTQDPLSRAINIGTTMDGSLVNMAGTAGQRVVTGIAPGTVSAASSEAINGSQLYAQGASTAATLGGGSTVDADGTVTAPSYKVGGTIVNNVGSAIANLDTRTTQNSADIAGLQTTIGGINGTVANAVQYDDTAHDRITLGGTTANAPKVVLTNLQNGDVSATSSDAVTGAQLWQTNQQIGNLNQSVQNYQTTGDAYVSVNSTGNAAQAIGNGSVAIGGGARASAPDSVALGEGSVADQSGTVSVGSAGDERRITNVAAGQAPTDAVTMQQFQGGLNEIARNAYSGTASAIALTMVPEVDANKNLAIGVATAGYKGYQAVAVGFSARVTQSLKVKLGAGISAATTTVGAGAAYQW